MNNEVAVIYNVGDSEIKLTPKIVSEYLAGGQNITIQEFKMFSELCKARGLNPFLREAYIIKYGNSPAQMVVGKDAILKKAILHPQFDGREQGVIVLTDEGETVERRGSFYLGNETLVGGWAKIHRKDWKYPVYVTVSFSEVAQKKSGGSLNKQWSTTGATMVEKVALVRAMRESFVDEIGGMYDVDEMAVGLPDVTIDQEPEQQEDAFEEPEQENDSKVIDFDEV